jgi:putative peptidoglycan lipid II flippase
MLGGILSRALGMIREVVIADLFGAGHLVDAFTIAAQLQTMIYDLLVSGMISAALIPVFTTYANKEDKAELSHIVSSVLTVAAVILAVLVVICEFAAPALISVLGSGFDPQTHQIATDLFRIILPGVILLGISAIFMSTLYSLQRFTYPAFAAAALNTAIVIAGIILAGRFGIVSLAIGMLVGSLFLIVLQFPGLKGVKLRPSFDPSHPALRQIVKLYIPVLLGFLVTQIGFVLDRSLASWTGAGSISAMRYATTLIQFALGLVATAIATAVLPTLSRYSEENDMERYKSTFMSGFKMIAVLILPASFWLLVMGGPVISLLYQHGNFTAADKSLTLLALLCYLPGLPFSAFDQLLIFAYYARKNTKTPVIVGVISVGVYALVALTLIQPFGMAGLAIATSAQWTAHALILYFLLKRVIAGYKGFQLGRTLLKVITASALMAGASYGIVQQLTRVIGDSTTPSRLVLVIAAAGAGAISYLLVIGFLRVEEIGIVWRLAKAKLLPNRA